MFKTFPTKCYKLIQRFGVTGLFTGQYTTEELGTITDLQRYVHIPWSVWYVHIPRSVQRYMHVPNRAELWPYISMNIVHTWYLVSSPPPPPKKD